MFDFDTGEWLFFGLAAVVAGRRSWGYWNPILRTPRVGVQRVNRFMMAAWPLSGLVVTYIVVQTWGDAKVRGHFDYVLLFLVGAVAWLGMADAAISVFGISSRDDAIERDNRAATVAVGSWLLGVSVVYALSNVGAGPTIWTTLAPACVGTIALIVAYLIIAIVGGTTTDDITIDCDLASGLRLAGALLSAALILGRAGGGQWTSWTQTWIDLLRYSWPVWPLALLAGVVHRWLRPSPPCPRPNEFVCGVAPALIYLLFGVVAVGLTPHGFEPSKW
jgi:uncharacterized membrane protein YjfL (UPF0719 family)